MISPHFLASSCHTFPITFLNHHLPNQLAILHHSWFLIIIKSWFHHYSPQRIAIDCIHNQIAMFFMTSCGISAAPPGAGSWEMSGHRGSADRAPSAGGSCDGKTLDDFGNHGLMFTLNVWCAICSGGWFGTFIIFPTIGNNHPNWLSYFSEGWTLQTSFEHMVCYMSNRCFYY